MKTLITAAEAGGKELRTGKPMVYEGDYTAFYFTDGTAMLHDGGFFGPEVLTETPGYISAVTLLRLGLVDKTEYRERLKGDALRMAEAAVERCAAHRASVEQAYQDALKHLQSLKETP